MGKIIMWATTKNGEGHVMCVGEYEDITDVKIRTNIFADDVLIEFEYEKT